jgi:predicted amidophosphoribosyltransferase
MHDHVCSRCYFKGITKTRNCINCKKEFTTKSDMRMCDECKAKLWQKTTPRDYRPKKKYKTLLIYLHSKNRNGPDPHHLLGYKKKRPS